MSQKPFRCVFAIYPGMTHLDFTGPHQFLSRLPGSETIVASRAGGAVEADGLTFAGTARLAEIESCDLICIPGGGTATAVALDIAFVSEVQRLARTARYITSVCTGSLILGAAGLLKGKRAATHWAWRHLLPCYGAIIDEGRVVRDGNIITGGGVTAGIDFALTVFAEIAGKDAARLLQLGLEYAPAPPFDCGRPELADTETLKRHTKMMAAMADLRQQQAAEAGRRLGLTPP